MVNVIKLFTVEAMYVYCVTVSQNHLGKELCGRRGQGRIMHGKERGGFCQVGESDSSWCIMQNLFKFNLGISVLDVEGRDCQCSDMLILSYMP